MPALFDPKEPFSDDSVDARRISSARSASISRTITTEVRRLQREFAHQEAKLEASPASAGWLERFCAGCYLTALAIVFGWAVVGRDVWGLVAVISGE